MAQEAIWPGSGSAVSESTPFGLYDNDTIFRKIVSLSYRPKGVDSLTAEPLPGHIAS